MTGEDFARALDELAGLELAAGALEHRLCVAGLDLGLRFESPRLAGTLARALAHHVVDAATAPRPACTVVVLDRDSIANPLRALPARMRVRDADGDDRVERWSYEGATGRGLLHEGFRALYLWHRASGRAAVCFDDARELPYYQVALPLLPLLGWMLAERGHAIVHAAAIATEAGAMLIGGRSGTGKSTTALACLDAGLGYLGDDLCVVELRTPPVVHSLFCSAKLDPADTDRFPALAPALVPATGGTGRNRCTCSTVIAPNESCAAPRCSAWRSRDAGRRDRRSRLSPSRAFLAIAPNTVFLLPGSAREAAAGVREVVTRVPVHALSVGTTIDEIPVRVREHAGRLSSAVARGSGAT